MSGKNTEACGRCSMTTVVQATGDGEGHNPFDGERIEIDESEMKAIARPQVAAGRLKDRIDEWATKLTYGR